MAKVKSSAASTEAKPKKPKKKKKKAKTIALTETVAVTQRAPKLVCICGDENCDVGPFRLRG